MTATILDGRTLSERIKQDIKNTIEQRTTMGYKAPQLDVILVGNDPASNVYVTHKEKACKAVGIISKRHTLPQSTTQTQLTKLITELNDNPCVTGILLQLPLPKQIDSQELLEHIAINKDVDGFHPYNLGKLMQRNPILRPCTPYGIIQLLKEANIDCNGKHAVIVSASNIVGRPLAMELLLQKATTTICHRFTNNLATLVQQADILVSAIGKPNIIQSDWIKPQAVVVDVGIFRAANGQICGDIDFDTAKNIASWITPVPGGVGPMTVATLLQNTLLAWQRS